MFNKNVVDFELYIGVYLGYLIACLEDFAEITINKIDLETKRVNYRDTYYKLIMKDWITKAYKIANP